MIRVVLADDQALLRQGLRSLLELTREVEVVGEAETGPEALDCILTSRPDVALLDVRMPGLPGLPEISRSTKSVSAQGGRVRPTEAGDLISGNLFGGVEVVGELRRRGAATPVILLTTFDDDRALLAGVRAGIAGFLLKDVALEVLLSALRTVSGGHSLILPAVTRRAARFLGASPVAFESAELPDRLTPREVEVVRLMAGGYSNREIAEALGTSEGTVKNQASSILSKLGVRDRTRAVFKALELGWLTGRSPGD